MKKVYLDYAAATPVDQKVIDKMLPFFGDKFFNPSSPYLPGLEVKNDYNQSKQFIAQSIGAKQDNLIMTAGATEAINLAFSGCENVVISGIEHPAVINVAKSKSICKISKVKSDGIIDLDDLQSLIDDQTDLVAVSLASSDIGTIQPISKIAQIIKQIKLERLEKGNQRDLILFCDAAQGLGSIKINVSRLGADIVSVSAAKIYGPKQIAALYFHPNVKLNPLILGGGQELGLRSGTQNVPFTIGFAEAVRINNQEQNQKIAKLRDYLEQELIKNIPNIKIIGNSKKRLANYLVISFGNIEAERLIYRLEEFGVYVSTGAACSANKHSDSLALKSIGLTEKERNSSIRISLGKNTTKDEIEFAKDVIIKQALEERNRKNVNKNN